MPDVTVKLSDGVREVSVEIHGSDDDPLGRAESAALRLLDATVRHDPQTQRAGFHNWSLSSDTERSPEE